MSSFKEYVMEWTPFGWLLFIAIAFGMTMCGYDSLKERGIIGYECKFEGGKD